MISGSTVGPTKKMLEARLALIQAQLDGKQDQIVKSEHTIQPGSWNHETNTTSFSMDFSVDDILIAGIAPEYENVATSCGIRVASQQGNEIILSCTTVPTVAFVVEVALIPL